jgi:hypothetical protein
MENTGMALRWRVQALDQEGKILTQSDWRAFSVEAR